MNSYENIQNNLYQLVWPGKEDAVKQVFSPCEVEMTGPVDIGSLTRGDFFIEGDNLDALKLLRDGFGKRIRFIYIDPPYNTGKRFAYQDNFTESSRQSQDRMGLDPGYCARRHSLWLSMMYPRLAVARELLSNDGIIYASIDESEVHNLIHIMDEIYGEENRIGIITWVKKKKGSHLSKTLRRITEFILAYGRDLSALDLFGEKAYSYKWQPLIKRINKEKVLKFDGGVVETTLKESFYPKGFYGKGGTRVELLEDIHISDGRIINGFAIRARTVWVQEKLDREIRLGTKVSINSMGMGPNVFRHNQCSKKKSPPSLLDHKMNIGTNEDAWNELREIFGGENIYSYPKPLSLIKYLINTVSKNDPSGIYLDFFAGSGTTGQAVWELNREDGGNRSFILVQNREKLEQPAILPDGTRIDNIAGLCVKRLEKTSSDQSFYHMKIQEKQL